MDKCKGRTLLLPSMHRQMLRMLVAPSNRQVAPNKCSHKNPSHCFDYCNCQKRNNNPKDKDKAVANREDGDSSVYTILRNYMNYKIQR